MKQKELAGWNKAEKKIIKTIMENTDDANAALMNAGMVIRKNLTPSIAKSFDLIHKASAGRSGSSLLDFFDVMNADAMWKRGYTAFPQAPGAVIRFNVDDLVQCIRKQKEMEKPESLILFYDVKVEDLDQDKDDEDIPAEASWGIPKLNMFLSEALCLCRFMAIEHEVIVSSGESISPKEQHKHLTTQLMWKSGYIPYLGRPNRIALYAGKLSTLADYQKMRDTCNALLKNKV